MNIKCFIKESTSRLLYTMGLDTKGPKNLQIDYLELLYRKSAFFKQGENFLFIYLVVSVFDKFMKFLGRDGDYIDKDLRFNLALTTVRR